MSDDEDLPQLSREALAALEEFYAQKNERETQNEPSKINRPFDENWQLSQFWYDDDTIDSIVKIVSNTIEPGSSICLISCPTLYSPLRRTLDDTYTVHLLEFDERFAIYDSDFIRYDFNDPLNVPVKLKSKYNLVIADPPFLSEECLSKTSQTIKFLASDKIILCTGKIMHDSVVDLLQLKLCNFTPRHNNNLANEFSCFSNFDIDSVLSAN